MKLFSWPSRATVSRVRFSGAAIALTLSIGSPLAAVDLAVRGSIVHTMAGDEIVDGVVLIEGGRIVAIGRAAEVAIPAGVEILQAEIVTPGLIDARATVGLTGILNQDHDQDQLERSEPIQPGLRAVDAYNPQDPLVAWLRDLGITTVHTGHAPGELISGQTMVVKTHGTTVDAAVLREAVAVAATLDESAFKPGPASPGTRGKAVAMLREALLAAREAAAKKAAAPANEPTARNLGHEALQRVLSGELPLLVYAQRAQDIASALRVAEEFGLRLWLDGAAEVGTLVDEVREAAVPVFVHPPMMRAYGSLENASFATAALLAAEGIPFVFQSGYEAYVPKVRVVLFEAAVAVAYGLPTDRALQALTIDAARLLGVADRVGSLEVGKDADLALWDADPFEYTSHCTAVVIDGKVVARGAR